MSTASMAARRRLRMLTLLRLEPVLEPHKGAEPGPRPARPMTKSWDILHPMAGRRRPTQSGRPATGNADRRIVAKPIDKEPLNRPRQTGPHEAD